MEKQRNAYVLARNAGEGVEYLASMTLNAANWTVNKAEALTFATLPRVDGAAARYRARFDADQVMWITE